MKLPNKGTIFKNRPTKYAWLMNYLLAKHEKAIISFDFTKNCLSNTKRTVWKSRQKHVLHFLSNLDIFSVKPTFLLKKLLKS